MLLNLTKKESEKDITMDIEVGTSKVTRSESTKLLGIEIDDQQNWKEHFNNLVNSLNKRTFVIRRISNQIPKKEIMKITQSILMSKLRYSLQPCNQVRKTSTDPTSANIFFNDFHSMLPSSPI